MSVYRSLEDVVGDPRLTAEEEAELVTLANQLREERKREHTAALVALTLQRRQPREVSGR